jgi:hypothetical protein
MGLNRRWKYRAAAVTAPPCTQHEAQADQLGAVGAGAEAREEVEHVQRDGHGVVGVVRDPVDLRPLPRQCPQGRCALQPVDQRLGALALRDAFTPVVRARPGQVPAQPQCVERDGREPREAQAPVEREEPAGGEDDGDERADEQGDDLGQRLRQGTDVVADAGQQIARTGLLEALGVQVQRVVEGSLAQRREGGLAGPGQVRDRHGRRDAGDDRRRGDEQRRAPDAGRLVVRDGVDDVTEHPRRHEASETGHDEGGRGHQQRAGVRPQQLGGQARRLPAGRDGQQRAAHRSTVRR